MYASIILHKLWLSEKFLYNILYGQKSVLGLRLMKSKTIIEILAMKLYIRDMRKWSRIVSVIFFIDKKIFIFHSLNKQLSILSLYKNYLYWSWNNEIYNHIRKRKIAINNEI